LPLPAHPIQFADRKPAKCRLQQPIRHFFERLERFTWPYFALQATFASTGPGKAGTRKIGRDAGTGKFIPVKVAERRAKTAVVETIKTPKKGSSYFPFFVRVSGFPGCFSWGLARCGSGIGCGVGRGFGNPGDWVGFS